MRLLTSLSTFLLSAALGCESHQAPSFDSAPAAKFSPQVAAKADFSRSKAPATEPVMSGMMGGMIAG